MSLEPFAYDVVKKIHFQKCFAMLKSSCDPVALSPDKKSCLALIDVLNRLNPDILEQFQDYISFPVFLHLKNGEIKKNETRRYLLEILLIIWSKVLIQNSDIFWRNLCLILDQIEDPDKESSEEFQLVVIKCINTLIKTSKKGVLCDVYKRENYPRISIAIFMCIQRAKNEKSAAVKIEALECLLTFVTGYSKFHDLREIVANIVMLMVPGLMSVCLEVVTASDVQNHKLNLLAVQLWGRTIGLVMKDQSSSKLSVFKMNEYEKHTPTKKSEDVKSMLMNQKRDAAWIKSSAEKLSKIISVMLRQVQHSNYKVRKQLAVEIDFILIHASRSMSSSLNYLVDTLIILSQDEHGEVSSVSSETIKRFSSKCDSDEQKLVEVIEECFYSLLTKLPRIFHGVDLDEKEKHLRLLGGYLDILGTKHVSKITKSSQHLSRLLKSLQIAATLECNVVSLLEEISIREVDENSTINDSVWKQFKYSNTPKFQTILESVCHKLVCYADVSVIIHSLLDDFSSNRSKKETILVLNFMLSSKNLRFSDQESVLRTLLITIMEPLADEKLAVTVGKDGAETRSEAQSNVIEICLICECVATIAKALGKKAFAPLLLRCLYPLLENAGSPVFALSVAGLKSINRIANLYGGGVGELVSQNVDYLSHHVTVNLKNVEKNPKVLSVLSVIMKHSSMEVLPSLYNIVNDVLVQSCDTFQEGNISAFLHVFHTFVSCLLSWLDIKSQAKKEKSIKKSVYEELLEYHKAKIDGDSWKEPEENFADLNDEEMEENLPKNEEKPESPDHIKFTLQILQRSLNFLPSKDTSVQIIVLQILEKGVLILSPYQDDLLPITYKIWSPLVARFSHTNSCLIINRAFSLLTTLGNTSKDFVRQQTLKDVLPSLCKNLIINAENSKNKLSTSSYVLSQPYKLQLSLLKGIGELCVDMDVTGKQLESVLDALDPYLSKTQPKTLQDACLSSYLSIGEKESNAVWVHLISRSSTIIEFNGPHPTRHYKVQGASIYEDYQENINFLLKQICDF